MRTRLPLVSGVLILSAATALAWQTPATPFDILIKGGRVLDGSGNPWVRADIGIRGDRIVEVGQLSARPAALVIDAKDRVVSPGFIDPHSHALDSLTNPQLRDARQLIAQGLTTVIGNPDGGGPTNLAQQRARLEGEGGIGINAALVIGHAAVRRAAMGDSQQRAPTADELERMKALVRQGVVDGAFGLSSGLFYEPGRYSKTEEVIALGPDNWGKSATMIAHIDAARARGVEVFADQYPYEASSTSLGAAVMPGQGAADAREAMEGPESKRIFLGVVKENIRRRGGPKSIVIASGRGGPALSGKNLEEIAASRGVTPEQAATDIVIAGGASIVSFNMSEKDIVAMMQQPWTMGSSDGGINLPGPSLPHPRSNGAFARRLAVYVRERKVISLEQSVRTMTSLTARVFGFTDRGEIRPGAFADIVIFDPAKVIDTATYAKPYELAAGIDWVIVNGQVGRREGEFTGTRAGRVLKK